MKKFINKLFFLILILSLINFLLLGLGKKLYYEDYDSYSLEFETYLMADSHGNPLSKNPEKFDVYNFSASSESYFDMKRKLNFLIEKGSIDTLIISVDDHTLSPYREKLNNLDRSRIYATHNDYDSKINHYKDLIEREIVFLQPKMGILIREYGFQKIKAAFFEKDLTEIKKTGNWADIEKSKKMKRAENRAESQFGYEEPSQKLKNTLEDIINICFENEITLIGIKFPITKTYSEMTSKKNMGADSIFIKKGIKVLDFSKLFFEDDSMFVNEDHLNKKGGEVFAEILGDSLQRMYYK